MLNSFIVKKFYRDILESERDYLNNILDDMREADVEVPDHVVERMVQRGIIDGSVDITNLNKSAIPGVADAILTLDEGIVYEVSNEAIGRTRNPFRIVVAKEFDDGFTMFIKIVPAKSPELVKILDVWKRPGKLPLYPPAHSLRYFKADWDIEEALEAYLATSSNNQEEESLEHSNH